MLPSRPQGAEAAGFRVFRAKDIEIPIVPRLEEMDEKGRERLLEIVGKFKGGGLLNPEEIDILIGQAISHRAANDNCWAC
jgi:hypothetical protein